MDYKDILHILDLMQAMAWPIVIYIIFNYLSEALRKLILAGVDFISTAKAHGVKITPSGIEIPGTQQTESMLGQLKQPYYCSDVSSQNKPEAIIGDKLEKKPITTEALLDTHEHTLVKEVMKSIDQFLATSEIGNENILKGLLCDAYISLYFERCFQRILGSQFKLLDKLYSTNHSIAEKEIITEFYEPLWGNTVPFQKWIDFLVHSLFVSIKKKKIHLTPQGEEFIKYIKKRNYNPDSKTG